MYIHASESSPTNGICSVIIMIVVLAPIYPFASGVKGRRRRWRRGRRSAGRSQARPRFQHYSTRINLPRQTPLFTPTLPHAVRTPPCSSLRVYSTSSTPSAAMLIPLASNPLGGFSIGLFFFSYFLYWPIFIHSLSIPFLRNYYNERPVLIFSHTYPKYLSVWLRIYIQ